MALENPPTQRLAIHSLEGSKIVVTPMFNPKEVSIDKSVPWAKQESSRGDKPALAFWSADGSVMSFELMFDTFESGSDVHATFVASLMKLAIVQDPDGAEDRKRPPKVAVRWGGAKLPDFEGVIESMSTKYTMFLPDGTPVRATCRLAIREAGRVAVVKP